MGFCLVTGFALLLSFLLAGVVSAAHLDALRTVLAVCIGRQHASGHERGILPLRERPSQPDCSLAAMRYDLQSHTADMEGRRN